MKHAVPQWGWVDITGGPLTCNYLCRAFVNALPEAGLLEALQLHLQLGEQSRQMQATQLLVDLNQLHSQHQESKDADSDIQPLQVRT